MATGTGFRISRARSAALAAALALLALAGGALWLRHVSRAAREEKLADLAAVSSLKAQAIGDWLRERLGDAAVLAESPFLREAVSAWMTDPQEASARRLLVRFKSLQEHYGYDDVLLVDRAGSVRLQLGDRDTTHAGALEALATALRERRAVLTSLHAEVGDAVPHLGVVAPLFDPASGSGDPLGAVILISNARQFLFPLIQRWPVRSDTAETLLVERRGDEVVFLNDLRFRPDAALALKVPLTRVDVPAVAAVLGREGPFEGLDYRGIRVLADLRPVPGTTWFVVAKIDRTELLSSLYRDIAAAGVVVLCLIGLAALGTGFLYKAQGKSLFRDLYRAERERREALEELKTTLHGIGDAVIATDIEGRVRLMNPVAERLTGWPQSEATGRPLEEVFRIVNEDTREAVESPVARVLRDGAAVGLANHTLLLARDGPEHPIADSGAPIRAEDGSITGVVLVFRDQAAERAAARSLAESEHRYRTFFDAAPIGKSMTAPDGRLLRVNPELCRMLGYSADELATMSWMALTHPDDVAESRECVRALLAGEAESWAMDKRYIARDGRFVWTHVTTVLQRDVAGAPLYFLTHILDINEQVGAREALRAHDERLRTTLRSIGEAVISTDQLGRVEYVNPVAAALTGWSEAEAAGRPLAEVFRIVSEDTHEPIADPVARVLRDGVTVGLANHSLLIARDGSERPIADSGAPIRDAGGAVTGVVLVFRDQSADRTAQKERLLLTDTIRTLVDEVYLFDAETLQFRFVNDGALRNLGFTLDQMRRMTPVDLKPEFTMESFVAAVQPLRSREKSRLVFETIHRRADGSVYPVEIHLQLFDHLGDRVFLAVIQDVTERRRAEDALQASQDAFRALSDGSPVMSCVLDDQRRVLTGNRAFMEASGWPNTELGSDRACGALGCINALDDTRGCGFGPRCQECVLRLAIEDTLRTGAPHRDVECHVSLRRQAKNEQVVLLASTNAFELSGKRRLVLCLIDITDRRNLEEQLRRAQKMEAVGTLAGGIAHDFNNLLQALLSLTQVARLQAKDSALEKTLAEIHAHVSRGAGLTRQLLLFSRQAPARREHLDLGTLVGEHAAMLQRLLPETINLVVETGAGPLWAEADAGQLGQVLTNLVVNARDAMNAGGRLTVSVSRRGREVVLEVADTGAGMVPEVRERIFDPFFTTKAHGKGTGLGLAVVWGIVKDHGGRVEVESEANRGSRFLVILPEARGAAGAAVDAGAEPELPRGSGERLLLVEDEEGARQGLSELLTALGYAVRAVGSAEEAGALPAAPVFDALLTDYRLPGANGLELARELGRRWPALKVVVMSGYAPDDLARDLFEDGIVRFLQKPFDMTALARALHDALAPAPPDPA